MTQAELREKLALILQRYANVPGKDAKFLVEDLEEITSYATEFEALADTPADGNIAYAHDTGAFFFRRSSAWQPSPNPAAAGVVVFATELLLLAATPSDSTIAYAQDTDVFWYRRNGAWAASSNPAGGGGGGVTIYTTEALLIAATPADGTLGYAQDTDRYWFRRNGAWDLKPNLVVQTVPITFPIDYATGTDPIVGSIFTSTADVTAYLTAQGHTHFKHIMACWECVPDVLTTTVTFSLQPGVHRPRPTEISSQAFHFRPSFLAKRFPIFLGGGSVVIGAAAPTAIASWETLVAAQVCTVATTANASNGLECKLDFAGTPFTAGALKGYFARIESPTPQHILIRDNTASSLYLNANYGTNPTGLNVLVVSPATIVRNSLDDINPACANSPVFTLTSENMWIGAPNSARFVFDTLRIDQYSTTGFSGAFAVFGSPRVSLTRVLNDQARLKDQGLVASSGTRFLEQIDEPQLGYFTFSSVSVRGTRLALVPGTGSAIIGLNYNRTRIDVNGYLTITSAFFGGCVGSQPPFYVQRSYVSMANACFDNFSTGCCQLDYCSISMQVASGPKNFWRNVAGTVVPLRLNFCTASGTLFDLVFEAAGGSCIATLGGDLSIARVSNGALGGLTGLIISAGNLFSRLRLASFTAVTSAAAELGISASAVNSTGGWAGSFVDFQKRWEHIDNRLGLGTLFNAVRVIAVGDSAFGTPGTLPLAYGLRYTTVGTTLEFKSPSDGPGVYGAPVNIGAGGRFTIFGATVTDYVVVDVVPSLLPGANATVTPYFQPRAFVTKEGDWVTWFV